MMMPERLAKTSPNEQVREMIGSGPFRFVADEYVSGSRVVYEKFNGYVPREEPAQWTAGGKVVNFDRLEWYIIPDPATQISALQNGEVDWLEIALPDLLPILQMAPNVTVQHQDPKGFLAFIRFNSLVPPFDNAALRRAVLMAVDQVPYMEAITGGDPETWAKCPSMFPVTMPGVLTDDFGRMPADLEAAKAAVKASGYNGERVVILHPTDQPNIAPHGLITADLLTKLGLNVDLQAMDWGTVTQRRQSKEPVENGGWSIFHNELARRLHRQSRHQRQRPRQGQGRLVRLVRGRRAGGGRQRVALTSADASSPVNARAAAPRERAGRNSMTRYILRRILATAPVLAVVALIVFSLLFLTTLRR